MKHIYLDKSFFFFLLIIILTGNFNHFSIYFLLLIIHEFGHTLTGIILGYKLDKISFYPCGGVTSFNIPLNIPLKKELLILIMGPIFQVIGYLILKQYIDGNYLTIYHYTLLIFNLLPIYPLDGGRIINILFNYHFCYVNSFYFTYIFSILILIGLFIYNIINFNLNLLLMIIVLVFKLVSNYRNLKYYYSKFLLERYLNNYSFKKKKYINSIEKFYRDREHVVKFKDEKGFLHNYFNNRL